MDKVINIKNFTTTREKEELLLQFGMSMTPLFFEFRQSINKTVERRNVHNIKGLSLSTTTVQTFIDTKTPMSSLDLLQRVGLAYSKKIKNGVELIVGGNVVIDKKFKLPVMLKYGRYSTGIELNFNWKNPLKFLTSGLNIVAKVPVGKVDLVLKIGLGITGISKVKVQARKVMVDRTYPVKGSDNKSESLELIPKKCEISTVEKVHLYRDFMLAICQDIQEKAGVKTSDNNSPKEPIPPFKPTNFPEKKHGFYCTTLRTVQKVAQIVKKHTKKVLKRRFGVFANRN